VTPNADEDSATQREADDAHILKDCPCCCKPLGEEGRFYLASRFIECPNGVTNIAQYFRSIGHRQSLIGGDGINKTMV
jgi:hypothetical protein